MSNLLKYSRALQKTRPSMIGTYEYWSEITGIDVSGDRGRPGGFYYNGEFYDSIWRENGPLATYYYSTENLTNFVASEENPVFNLVNGTTILRSFITALYVDVQPNGSKIIYGFYAYPKGDGETSLCLATSTDFISWTELGIVKESQVDEPGGIYAGACIKVNGRLYVFCSVANQFDQSTALYDIKCYSSITPSDVNSYDNEGVVIARSGSAAGTHLSSVEPVAVNYHNGKFEMIVNDIDGYNKLYGFRSSSLLSGYTEIQEVYQDFLTIEDDYIQFQEQLARSCLFFDPVSKNWYMYYSLRDETTSTFTARIARKVE